DAVEVVEVAGGAGGEVLVVSDAGVVERVGAPPGAGVDRLELRQGGVVVLLVAERENAGQSGPDHQVGRGPLLAAAGDAVTGVVAGVGGVARDVARGADHRVGAGRRRRRGGGS